MKKIIFIFLFSLSSVSSSDWVFFLKNIKGDLLLYERERVKRDGNNVYVWERIRFKNLVGNGYKSNQTYFKINCIEYSFEILQSTNYSDDNWENQIVFIGREGKVRFIPPNSSIEVLANKVCR